MRIWGIDHADLRNGLADLTSNLQIAIAVNIMVKLKNLFRQKDGLGPCLEEANITQHLPLNGELQHQICHLYSGAGGYKIEWGEGVKLSQLQKIREATSPVEQETRTGSQSLLSIVDSKLFFIFLP
jgi:hypothetical protein